MHATRSLLLVTLLSGISLLGACKSGPPTAADPWQPSFRPPERLHTGRVVLEPLAPEHTALDYAAFMGSREHLRTTLHWGDWPRASMTLADNRRDLQRHFDEFQAREAYAYTVLTPDGTRCVGCVYMNPDRAGGREDMSLAYWVVEPELATDLDRHLLASVLRWVEKSWPLRTVLVPTHPDNVRGLRIAREMGLREMGRDAQGRVVFAWRKL